MELFLLRHSEWQRLYNCTGLDPDLVPIAERRRFVPEAWVTILLCAIYYALYVPCLYSIRRHCRANPCYQLLLYIGVMDCAILWILGFLHGWLSLQGAVFCTYPVLIYWAGLGATAFWMAESTADLILAINRCLEMVSPVLAHKFFGGYRVLLWLGFCTLYALYWLIFVKPVVFSSIFFAWFFYPFVGYREDTLGEFSAPLHSIHDTVIAVASPFTYLVFVLIVNMKKSEFNSTKMSHAQKMVFLQVFIISTINTLTGSLYVLMQHMEPSQWMITLGEFAWFHIHGFPPVIYLALNKTMREDCRILLMKLLGRKKMAQVHSIPVAKMVTTNVPSTASAMNLQH